MLRRVRELKAELWARPHCTVAALQRRNQEAAANAAATAAAAAAATAAAAAAAAQRHARVAAVHVPPLTAVQQYFGARAVATDEQPASPRPDLREVTAEVHLANALVFEGLANLLDEEELPNLATAYKPVFYIPSRLSALRAARRGSAGPSSAGTALGHLHSE